MDQGDGYGPHTVYGKFGYGLGSELPVERNIYLYQIVQTGVITTHPGNYICHITEFALHGTFLEAHAIFCQHAKSEPVGEYLQVGYEILDPDKIGVEGNT